MTSQTKQYACALVWAKELACVASMKLTKTKCSASACLSTLRDKSSMGPWRNCLRAFRAFAHAKEHDFCNLPEVLFLPVPLRSFRSWMTAPSSRSARLGPWTYVPNFDEEKVLGPGRTTVWTSCSVATPQEASLQPRHYDENTGKYNLSEIPYEALFEYRSFTESHCVKEFKVDPNQLGCCLELIEQLQPDCFWRCSRLSPPETHCESTAHRLCNCQS